MKRNVYVLNAPAAPGQKPQLQRVEIKTGITDGSSTEVLDGLEEGTKVVSAILSSDNSGQRGPAANPFGGGMRRF
jgi:multidrug efflux pump subunit AcrA (membrane-fusion protein)